MREEEGNAAAPSAVQSLPRPFLLRVSGGPLKGAFVIPRPELVMSPAWRTRWWSEPWKLRCSRRNEDTGTELNSETAAAFNKPPIKGHWRAGSKTLWLLKVLFVP